MQAIQHGTATGYSAGGCRCPECREAAMGARRRARERRRLRVAAGDRQITHGTWAAYLTDKCRCSTCKDFKSDYMRDYRAKRAAAR